MVRPNREVIFIKEQSQVVATVLPDLRSGDLVITLGAGDIWRVADDLVAALRARTGSGQAVSTPTS